MSSRHHLIKLCAQCGHDPVDSRLLPCLHTYCFQCIAAYCRRLQLSPGIVRCPICRIQFQILGLAAADTCSTDGGDDWDVCRHLPKSVFVEKLQKMDKLKDVLNEEGPCQICHDEADPKVNSATVLAAAAIYCQDCQLKICKTCSAMHNRLPATRKHRQVQLTEYQKMTSLDDRCRLPPDQCDRHPDELGNLFCVQCSEVICWVCRIDRHKTHLCSYVESTVGELGRKVADDVEAVVSGRDSCKEKSEQLSKDRKAFADEIVAVRSSVLTSANRLKALIDRAIENIVEQLERAKQIRFEDMDRIQEQIHWKMISMEHFRKYSELLSNRGASSDIARESGKLRHRAAELCKLEEIQTAIDSLGSVSITFKPLLENVEQEVNRLLGKLSISTVYSNDSEADKTTDEIDDISAPVEVQSDSTSNPLEDTSSDVIIAGDLGESRQNGDVVFMSVSDGPEIGYHAALPFCSSSSFDKRSESNVVREVEMKVFQQYLPPTEESAAVDVESDRPGSRRSLSTGTRLSISSESVSSATDALEDLNNTRPPTPTLTAVVSTGSSVQSVTSFGSSFYVVRWPSRQQIEEYDVNSLQLKRLLAVADLGDTSYGLAAAAGCLYASDFAKKIIHCIYVSLAARNGGGVAGDGGSGGNVTTAVPARCTRWAVEGGDPTGLSITSQFNLLVTCVGNPSKLQEFSTYGNLIREIRLPASVSSPWQAFERAGDDEYVVCHGDKAATDSLHRVCLIRKAKILRFLGLEKATLRTSFGGVSGSGQEQLNYPTSIAVDRNGFILVADGGNDRVVVLDRKLKWSRDLIGSVGCSVKQPCSLHLDEARGRLYVGEWKGGHVTVFDNVISGQFALAGSYCV